eukprot:scaffold238615_cov40-Cyclotella_meneghiniana.AAC.1
MLRPYLHFHEDESTSITGLLLHTTPQAFSGTKSLPDRKVMIKMAKNKNPARRRRMAIISDGWCWN